MTTLGASPLAKGSREAGAPLLHVRDLAVTFYTPRGTVRAVRQASLDVRRGEVVGLVGESGCGKSTVAYALMGYLPDTAEVEGAIEFEGLDVAQLSEGELRELRGNRMAMVYQDPITSLNPTMRVGDQVAEAIREHLSLSSDEALHRAAELFSDVGLPTPDTIGRRYPHELSGGQQQRVVIAMGLACDPDLLIMDEPTTGLDVTTEATILDLVSELKDRVNAGILFVSHNLGVIARVADRVAVMYAGETVEDGPVREIFKQSAHPYTQGLLTCVPKPVTETEGTTPKLRSIPGSVYEAEELAAGGCLFSPRCPLVRDQCRDEHPVIDAYARGDHTARCFAGDETRPEIWGEPEERESPTDDRSNEVLEVRDLRQFYGEARKRYLLFGPETAQPVRAVVDIDFDIGTGRTLGIVGESGSGKSTTARAVIGLDERVGGEVRLRGVDLAGKVANRTDGQRAAMRMVFQNPQSSLNPKLPIGHALKRSLRKFAGLRASEVAERAGELLEAVGLDRSYLHRLPSELSGGQQQRVALANAFAANPELIIADEAVSALDVSVQAQVLNLLAEHQRETGTSYMFISHDLGVVRYISDEILVMYAGHVAESGPAEAVLSRPWAPYTEALLSAAPVPDPDASSTLR